MAMPYHDYGRCDDDSPTEREGFERADANEQGYKDARSFRGLDGSVWYAHVVAAETFGAPDASLLLVSANQLRRITPVPKDWRTLSAQALLQLPFSSLRSGSGAS